MQTPGVDETLKDRNGVHGLWSANAEVSERIKKALRGGTYWETMLPSQREALDLIAVKMSRIVTGNPNYSDHWHDIQGYARLVEKELLSKHGPINEKAPSSRAAREG